MDPNQVLKRFRQAYSDWEDTRGKGEDPDTAVAAADEMRDAMYAMDEWLSAGGFLPDDWANYRD